MREILFHGKRKDTGEWVEGFYVHFVDSWKNCETHRIYLKSAETDGGDYYPDWYEVDPGTVGQFIGLTDKNGNKIFEGDIIVFNRTRNLPNKSVVPEVIGWNQGDCAFQRFPRGCCLTRGGAGKLIQPDMMSECEVIGNIYDDRKLLEKVLL